MRSWVRVWSALAVGTLAGLVPLAAAQNEDLGAAAKLMARQEYKAAQDALQQIDRDQLSAAERREFDRLMDELPEALQRSEKAAQDLAAGDGAYDAGDWEAATRAYQAVQDNKYALPAWRTRAGTQLALIAEKRKLADAAKPTGAIEDSESRAREEARGEEPRPVPPPPAPVAPPPEMPVEEAAGEGPRRLTPTDELRMREDLLWQRAVAVAEAATAAARDDIAAHDFATARQRVASALQTLDAAASYAEPVSKYQAARQAVLTLQAELEREETAFQQAQAAREREEVAERIARRRAEAERQRTEKVLQLFNTAEQLRKDRRYAEAAEVLREVLRIDPGNAEARYQLNWAEDLESFSRQQDWQDDVDVQRRRALINAEEALIPWDVDVMYPRNWLELTARRAASGITTGRNLGDAELNRQLDARLPEIRFEETPFEGVVQFLGEMTKVNLSVDWTGLTDAGVARDAPVTVQLNNVAFRTVLNEVLAQVGRDTRLAFSIGDGLLRISTKEKLDRDKVVLIYDIRDLLVNVPRATRVSTFNVSQGMGQGSSGGGGGGGGGSGGMFQQGQQQQTQEQYGQEQNNLAEQIMDIIRQTVEPDSWRENGAGDASIRDLNGQLIIYNTSDAHRQVTDLLTQLRETRALQISVESRFLNVTSNFLEEFGVDLDFVLNSGNAGYDQATGAAGTITDPATGAIVLIPREFARIGAFAAPPAFGIPLAPGVVPQQPYNQAAFVPAEGGVVPQMENWTPVAIQQNSITLARPNAVTGVPGSYGSQAGVTPALSISGSFLDNLQVDFLIRATQANSRSSIVQAPRIVLFNGQASSISIGRSRTYVSSLEPQLAEGAVGFQPITNTADSGVFMYVEGTISADRRYVTLTVSIQQRDEPIFERFEVQRASGNSPGAFILLPDQSFAIMETTVSVPDGGTVLLGGLKQVGEIEVEAGVPLLNKIPVLKRAFTNNTRVKDTRTLLILVKSKIIIQKEAEDEAFPTFTQAGT